VSATHTLDVDEIQTTRGEKALAVVLAIFLLIGLVWAYTKIDTRDDYYVQAPVTISAADQVAIDAHTAALRELSAAQSARAQALADLELKRERYRTALDAGQPARGLRREYRAAEQTFADATARVSAAEAREAETRPAAQAAEERRFEQERERFLSEGRVTFLLRLGYVLAVLAAAYGLLVALRGSRYFSLGIAAVGAGAVLSIIFAGDYTEDYVDLQETGPVVLSVAGIALTIGAFWTLQRYLQRRIPLRRVRKHECPFCGFPVGGNERCEGCGRGVVASCSHCGESRRVGVLFCGTCGRA
jgi:ABC-type multidrug transport system fused ATPase/permease subunit